MRHTFGGILLPLKPGIKPQQKLNPIELIFDQANKHFIKLLKLGPSRKRKR